MYHKELIDQQARVTKLEHDIANKNPDLDENAEYILKQEVRSDFLLAVSVSLFLSAPPPEPSPLTHSLTHSLTPHPPCCLRVPKQRQAVNETKAVFGPLRQRITDAVAKLEEQIALSESGADGGDGSAEQLAKAREVLTHGHETLKAAGN